jgi:hypothetical protein
MTERDVRNCELAQRAVRAAMSPTVRASWDREQLLHFAEWLMKAGRDAPPRASGERRPLRF